MLLQSIPVVFHHDATGHSTILKWWLVCITFTPPAGCIDQCSRHDFQYPENLQFKSNCWQLTMDMTSEHPPLWDDSK